LILGQASLAGNNAARQDSCGRRHPGQTVAAGKVQSGLPAGTRRFEYGTTHRSHRPPRTLPKFTNADDPNDGDTTDAPGDDDVWWDDPHGNDDTGALTMAWNPEIAPELNAVECALVIGIDPSSPSFLTFQRLRC
jgi:hypothetical protein